MNFFEQQDQARKSTRVLIGLFGLSVATMTGCIYLATIVSLGLSPLSGGSRCLKADKPGTIAPHQESFYLASRGLTDGGLIDETLMARSSSRSRSSFGGSRFGSSSRSTTSGFGSGSSSRSTTSGFGTGSNSDSGTSRFGVGSSRFFERNHYRRPHPSSSYLAVPCPSGKTEAQGWWHPQILLWVTLLTGAVVGGASWFKIWTLRGGGAVIAQELGGQLLLPEMADEKGLQLLNVVEEMAIASGIPVPPVYLMEQEQEINAFAAGYSPETAVIGVTRGSLEQLTRDELQGVIGHEFSHILNGDMRLNIRLMGIIHGILFIYLAGRVLMFMRDRRNNQLWLLGLSLMGVGLIGSIFGRLIQSAVSRQREFLADASAVQFTRNPAGIASALEKLLGIGSRLETPHAETASHMFFGNALGFVWGGNWFATHPPLPQRIEKIRGLPFQAGSSASHARAQNYGDTSGAMGFAGQSGMVSSGAAPVGPSNNSGTKIAPDQVVNQVGTVSPEHYAHVQGLLAQIPEAFRTTIRDPQRAIATLYALFVETQNSDIRKQQMECLSQAESEAILVQVLEQEVDVRFLSPQLRLPLVDLTIPALRQCTPEQLQTLLETLRLLAKADGEWSLTEFVLFLVLQRRLDAHFFPDQKQSVQYQKLEQVWDDCLNLLSALAHASDPKPEAIAFAFRSGLFHLERTSQQPLPELPPTWTLETLQHSLDRLRQASPSLKKTIVNACAHTVLLDGEVTIQEAELLRAITITLDCPIPPFLNSLRPPKKSPNRK